MGSTASPEEGVKAETGVRPSGAGLPPINCVCVSDTHGLHNRDPPVLQLPPGDVLLFAGDAGVSNERQWQNFVKWLGAQPHKHKVITYGNMDDYGESNSPSVQGVDILVDRIAEVAGYRIFGSPYTPKYFGAFQLWDDHDAEAHWSKALPPEAQVDVLLTHGPPYGYGDQARGRHVGDKALLKAYQALKQAPLLWVVGHIHESYGPHELIHKATGAKTLLINAASYYLTKGHPDAAPCVVQLPDQAVSQPTLQQQQHDDGSGSGSGSRQVLEGGEGQQQQQQRQAEVWQRPADKIVL